MKPINEELRDIADSPFSGLFRGKILLAANHIEQLQADVSRLEKENMVFRENSISPLLLKSVKRHLFKMWLKVERGQFDSRSFVGDTALAIRTLIYEQDDETFFKEYEAFKEAFEKAGE